MNKRIATTPDRPVASKMLGSLEDAFDACGISDGWTLSFHHHLRNGDAVVNHVLEIARKRNLKDLRLAMSSVFPVHAPLVPLIRSGVISRIHCGYAKGPVADEIASGTLPEPALLQTHGGRARAIETGALEIDVAFVAAPTADVFGGATGALGRNACGPLGYPMVDADYARKVVVVAEEVHERPLEHAEIPAGRVDHVVEVETIGNASGIRSGATQVATDDVSLGIARLAAKVIAASGVMREGFSFQTGAGGVSLAVTKEIGEMMRRRGIVGDFISGGITGAQVDLARAGIFERIVNVQSFDMAAVESYRIDPWHEAMSASKYASPVNPEAIVDRLGATVLGAAEIDREFNVNVTTGGDGRIIGGPGGHPDTAAGAKLAVVTTRLTGGGYPKIVEKVGCVTTPGRDVDVLVTDQGIAVNPGREDLRGRLARENLQVVEIGELIKAAERSATKTPVRPTGDICARIEYRDGSIIDEIRSPAEPVGR